MSKQVAQTILNQLGGGMFVTVTGSKNFVADDNSLTMKLARNKAKATHLKISLNSMDTYDIEYQVVTNPTARNGYTHNVKTVAEFEGYYCDMLKDNFEQTTGLYTSL